MPTTHTRRTMLAVLAGAVVPAGPAFAQSQQTIHLYVPFTAGTGPDLLARLLGEELRQRWNHPVIVENKPGASGNIGTLAAARAAPDGQTLLIAHIGILAVNPSLYACLQYQPLTSFAFVAPLAQVPNVLCINPGLPIHNIAELIAYAKANPGKLNFSSAGIGGAAHIAMAAFNVAAGTVMTHVPYRGTPPSITDVISGQVQATFTSGVSLLPHVRSGALRALGFGTPKRIAAATDIPAIAETVPGFEASSWYGIVAPAGTPDAIARRLYPEVRKAMASPEIARRLNNEGAEHWDISPEEFRSYVAAEIQRWKGVIEAAGMRVE
jgi:tripartite-type tricarboxylate transporter receptor subunit TctC